MRRRSTRPSIAARGRLAPDRRVAGGATRRPAWSVPDGVLATHGTRGQRAALGVGDEARHGARDAGRRRGGRRRPRRAAGPPGSTVRHLLAHASGLPFEGEPPIAGRASGASTRTRASRSWRRTSRRPPRCRSPTTCARRCFGRSGWRAELAARRRRGLRARSTTLLRLARELLAPTLVAPRDARRGGDRAVPRASPACCPASGASTPNDWGLGFELRDGKSPHWTGARNSPRTFGHFGRSGTFLWVDPEAGLALRVPHRPRVRRLGEGGVAAPLRRRARVGRAGSRTGATCRRAYSSSTKSGCHELVERLAVAAGDRHGGQRRHRRRSGHVHGERDLAEVVAGPQHAARAEAALVGDRQHARDHAVEVVALLALEHDGAARLDVLALHPAGQLGRGPRPGARRAGRRGSAR